jgi:hypothetical protein
MMTSIAPIVANPPDDIFFHELPAAAQAKFKRENFLKADVTLDIQDEQEDGSFVVNGQVVSVESCEPTNTFAGTNYIVNGAVQVGPPSSGVCSVTVGTTTVHFARDQNSGQLISALAHDKATGEGVEIVPVPGEAKKLATVRPQDYNEKRLGRFQLAHVLPPSSVRRLKAWNNETDAYEFAAGLEQQEGRQRRLAPECTSSTRRIIKLKLGYDSSYCEDHVNGEQGVLEKIDLVVIELNRIYDQVGLCKRIEVR